MRRTSLILVCVLGVLLVAGGIAFMHTSSMPQKTAAKESPIATETKEVGIWQPPAGLKQINIWPNGAPDMESVDQRPENVVTKPTPEAIDGDVSEAVFDVSSPTMTIFPPKGVSARAAVVVFPGGGFKMLAVTIEGTEICNWLTSKGITCILAKYRVPDSNHHYDPDCHCGVTPKVLRALQDAQRTIRLVRSKADELKIDPAKIGVMGFSAGGYLVAQTSNIFEPAYKRVDAVDNISSRPNFAIAFFPGHLCRYGGRLDPGIKVTKKTPPTFLLQAWDDPVDPICNSTLYARALNDNDVAAEVHLFAKGGHAFGLRRARSPDRAWPSLLDNWLRDEGILAR